MRNRFPQAGPRGLVVGALMLGAFSLVPAAWAQTAQAPADLSPAPAPDDDAAAGSTGSGGASVQAARSGSQAGDLSVQADRSWAVPGESDEYVYYPGAEPDASAGWGSSGGYGAGEPVDPLIQELSYIRSLLSDSANADGVQAAQTRLDGLISDLERAAAEDYGLEYEEAMGAEAFLNPADLLTPDLLLADPAMRTALQAYADAARIRFARQSLLDNAVWRAQSAYRGAAASYPSAGYPNMEDGGIYGAAYGGYDPYFEAAQSQSGAASMADFQPNVDMYDEGNQYIVRVDLPGVGKSNVKVEIQDEKLFISGERETAVQKTDAQGRVIARERGFGAFYRSITLPGLVKEDEATAEQNDGVLTITLPKREDASRSHSVAIR
jgi:HSP20 family protein